MRILWMLGLVLPLAAGEIEGTAWYDAGGELVMVDGPAAESRVKVAFVPEWRTREIERRERMARPARSRYRDYAGDWDYGYGTRYGWSVVPVSVRRESFSGCYRSQTSFRRPNVSVIIR